MNRLMVHACDEQRFIEYLDSMKPENEYPTSSYAFVIDVELRFVRSRASEVIPVRVTRGSDAPAVRLTEEQIREKYPWDYKELTSRCRERYDDFKVDQKYHTIRKSLEGDPGYAYERRLDPEKLRPKKVFYSPNILGEFDKHYTRNGN